jgi:hypothetical protein
MNEYLKGNIAAAGAQGSAAAARHLLTMLKGGTVTDGRVWLDVTTAADAPEEREARGNAYRETMHDALVAMAPTLAKLNPKAVAPAPRFHEVLGEVDAAGDPVAQSNAQAVLA